MKTFNQFISEASEGGSPYREYKPKPQPKPSQPPEGFDAFRKKYLNKKDDKKIEEGNKSGDSSLRDWFSKSRSSDGKPGWVQLGGKYAGKPCAKQPGQTTKPKCGSSKMKRNLSKDEEDAAFRRKQRQDPNPDRKGKAINVKTEETQSEATYPSDFRNPDGSRRAVAKKKTGRPNAQGPESGKKEINEGEKDACYHKVKSRYSVWPSAYASGALVKCRKVGAKNWGNKTKKESYDLSNWRDSFEPSSFESLDVITPKPLEPTKGLGADLIKEAAKKCWPGYEKKGTKKMFGKTYNNCVKKEEKETNIGGGNLKKLAGKAVKRIDADVDGDVDSKDMKSPEVGEFVPSPTGKKMKPKVRFESSSDWRSELGEDWQKVNKSDKTDGMSQKAVAAYRRENPGSKLKTAVTGDPKPGSKDAKRRKSFCSRSDGQRKMHNIDCSKTPDKAICKARRRWKC